MRISKIQTGCQGAPKCLVGCKNSLPLGFWRSRQLELNKFFDPRIPSMRKVKGRAEKKKREKNNGVHSGH